MWGKIVWSGERIGEEARGGGVLDDGDVGGGSEVGDKLVRVHGGTHEDNLGMTQGGM